MFSHLSTFYIAPCCDSHGTNIANADTGQKKNSGELHFDCFKVYFQVRTDVWLKIIGLYTLIGGLIIAIAKDDFIFLKN